MSLWLAVILFIPLNGSAQLEGEQVLERLPVPEHHWREQSPRIQYNDMTQWRDEHGTLQAQRLIRYASGGYPALAFRQATERQAIQACDGYQSELISDKPVNGYPRQLWLGRCQQSATLHLYLTGQAHGYYYMRVWQTAQPADLDLWVAYFEGLWLCDTTEASHPCEVNSVAQVEQSAD